MLLPSRTREREARRLGAFEPDLETGLEFGLEADREPGRDMLPRALDAALD